MKLSIIVPVYKVEKYLNKCVDSILAQTLTDFECILVDDGSPDNCPAMCDEYAEKDPRIVVIHKENGGLSDARNAGLDVAKGDYIGFVDSDDWVDPTMYEDLYDAAVKNNVSIAASKIKRIDNTGKAYKIQGTESGECTVYPTSKFINDFDSIARDLNFQAWCKIYSKRLFQGIRFPKGVWYEDAYIILDLLEQCDSISVIDKCHYNYRNHRPDSIMNSSYSYAHTDQLKLCNKLIEFYKKRDLNKQADHIMVRFADYYIPNHLLIHLQYKKFKKNFRSYKKQAFLRIPTVLKNKNVLNLKKLIFTCLFISPRLSMKLCEKYFPELFLEV